jgi:hypothetical protein
MSRFAVTLSVGLVLTLAAHAGFFTWLVHHQHIVAPVVDIPTSGPQCTIAYPRGFKFTKREAKLKPCEKLDVDGVVWGRCSRRIPT